MVVWKDQLLCLHPPNSSGVRFALPMYRAAEVQLMQWGESKQSLSLPAMHVFQTVISIKRELTGVFRKNTEASEPRGIDSQVSQVAGLQAPVKTAAISLVMHAGNLKTYCGYMLEVLTQDSAIVKNRTLGLEPGLHRSNTCLRVGIPPSVG